MKTFIFYLASQDMWVFFNIGFFCKKEIGSPATSWTKCTTFVHKLHWVLVTYIPISFLRQVAKTDGPFIAQYYYTYSTCACCHQGVSVQSSGILAGMLDHQAVGTRRITDTCQDRYVQCRVRRWLNGTRENEWGGDGVLIGQIKPICTKSQGFSLGIGIPRDRDFFSACIDQHGFPPGTADLLQLLGLTLGKGCKCPKELHQPKPSAGYSITHASTMWGFQLD